MCLAADASGRELMRSQVQAFMIQAAALATEACNSRMNAVHKQFPPTTFVDKDFQVTPLTLTEPTGPRSCP